MRKITFGFYLLFVLLNIPTKSLYAQICDTIEFDYEVLLEKDSMGNEFSLQIGRIRLNRNICSHPIINCDSSGEIVSAMIVLNFALQRGEMSNRYLKIKSYDIIFVALTDSINGQVNQMCFFYPYGNLPSKMNEVQREYLSNLLKSRISTIIDSWDFMFLGENIKSMPKEVDLQVPLHCDLIIAKSIQDKFETINPPQ